MTMSANDFAVKKATEFLEQCPCNEHCPCIGYPNEESKTGTTSSGSMTYANSEQASTLQGAANSTTVSSNASHQQLSPKNLSKGRTSPVMQGKSIFYCLSSFKNLTQFLSFFATF